MDLIVFAFTMITDESGMCEQFIYKGAGGNDNRFEALELCLNECHDVVCPW